VARDLKPVELLGNDTSYQEVIASLRSEPLASIAATYQENMARFEAASVLPGLLVLLAHVFQNVTESSRLIYGMERSNNQPFDLFYEIETLNPDEQIRYNVICNDTLNKSFKQLLNGERDQKNRELVTNNLLAWTTLYPSLYIGVDAFLSSLIILMWTNFEILAGDLWEIALNYGPKEWRENVVNLEKKGELQPDGRALTATEKKFSISELENPKSGIGLDLRNQFGTLCRHNTKLVSFKSYFNIKAAYNCLHGDTEDVSIFNMPEHEDVQGLAALRNVLAHNAGKKDRGFNEQTKGYSRFDSIDFNYPIPIDGNIVRELTDSAVRLGNALLIYTDKKLAGSYWLPEYMI
jgi:hypothetical protein